MPHVDERSADSFTSVFGTGRGSERSPLPDDILLAGPRPGGDRFAWEIRQLADYEPVLCTPLIHHGDDRRLRVHVGLDYSRHYPQFAVLVFRQRDGHSTAPLSRTCCPDLDGALAAANAPLAAAGPWVPYRFERAAFELRLEQLLSGQRP